MLSQLQIRRAEPVDAPHILGFIQRLADYEKEPDAVEVDVPTLEAQLASPRPPFECLLAEAPEGSTRRPVGFALFFQTYSTWKGRPGMWLEDLFVLPEARGQGVGRALLGDLAKRCVKRGYGRLEWNVLDWNEPALEFYRDLGAAPLSEWTVHRVTGDALARLAEGVRSVDPSEPIMPASTSPSTPGIYSHPVEMASYNRWQNEVVYARCAELNDAERKRDRGMFFRSLHDTLDHILNIDRLIVRYLEQGDPPPMKLERLYDDFTALHRARVAMDRTLCEQAASWTPAWLSSEIVIWSERLDRERRLPRGLLVSQLFNHQTHHRSQVTAHLHLMGIDYGNTDLPFNPHLRY